MKLNDRIKINKKDCQSRIVMPPLVCFNWADNKGYETVSRANHYGMRSKDTGIIVIEATAISDEGRFADTMLGIWEDGHIDQFKRTAEACHEQGALALLQIVHGGYHSIHTPYSASDYDFRDKEAKALTLDQISQIKEDFIAAAVRAYKAGLDGVEVHGAHTYLLNQFTSSKVNRRQDLYGGSLENRCRLPLEIVKAIREATSQDFIIGYRFGCNDETFKEDIYLLKELDKSGVDFFNVSSGFISNEVDMPADSPYHFVTYLGVHLKDYTDKPLACVFGIKEAKTAIDLIENYQVPMVAVGKNMLADPLWSTRAINKQPIDICYNCKPRCQFGINGSKCPYAKEDWVK
jgi:2,4-dienoyl-CoA reductase-like NADH-dependent reductase (Old Yellow Enzyme family)